MWRFDAGHGRHGVDRNACASDQDDGDGIDSETGDLVPFPVVVLVVANTVSVAMAI